jgi:hypothetical protein
MTHPRIIGLWSPAPGCGKSSVAQLLRERHGHIRLAFADPMKWMLVRLLQSAGYSDNEARRIPWHDKETPLDRLPGAPTMRHLLRTLGTEWGRDHVHQELWVQVWREQAVRLPRVVADDVRMPNEAAMIRELGGELWEIRRPGYNDTSGHRSEAGLPGVTFDRVISNDGTLTDLAALLQGEV